MQATYILSKLTWLSAMPLVLAATASGASNPLFCASTNGTTCSDNASITLPAATPGQADLSGPSAVYILTSQADGVGFKGKTSDKWLIASCNGAAWSTVPDTCGIYGNASSISSAQSLTGTITLTTTNLSPQVTITIQVTFNVGTSGGGSGGSTPTGGTLQPSPSSVSFSYPSGSSTATVTVNAAAGGASSFYATLATQSGGQWVTLSCPNGSSCNSQNQPIGAVLTLTLDPTVAQTLATNQYTATVTLSNAQNSTDQTVINITLSVNGATGSGGGTSGSGTPAAGSCNGVASANIAAPSSLSFVYSAAAGARPAAYQSLFANGGIVSVTSASNTSPNFISTYAWTSSGGPMVAVAVQPGVPEGSYSGSVAVTTSLGCQVIPVSLTVSSSPTLVAYPGSITCDSSSGSCADQALSFGSIDGTTAISFYASSSTPWITLKPAVCGPSTPVNCTVSLNASALPSCLNTAGIDVFSRNSATGLVGKWSVPVAVRMARKCAFANGPLTISAASLNFTSDAPQTLYVTAGSTTTFTAKPQTSNCGSGWLSISPAGTLTYSGAPVPIQVSVLLANLSAGLTAGTQCSGEVDLTASGGDPQPVQVTYVLPSATSGNVILTSGSTAGGSAVSLMTFTAQAGGPNASPQYVYVSAAGGATGVGFNYSSSAAWLLVSGAKSGQGVTPAALPITVSPGGLAAGTYTGTVTIGSSSIFVALTVTAPSLSATPATLNFTYTVGGTPPSSQTVNVSGNGAASAFTATSGATGNWLTVTPTFGTTTSTGTVPLTVSVTNLDSLQGNQTYSGVIVVAGTSGAAGASTVAVNLTITIPKPTILKIVNTASGSAGPIAAGEWISILGTGLGPTPGIRLTQPGSSNQLATTTGLGGVRVTIGGYPAPLMYVSGLRLDAAIPYEINSPYYLQSPSVVVQYLGQTSNSFDETQVVAAPGIFTADGTGSGPGAILNSDNSPNCHCATGRPANKGESVVLYVTGEGQTIPGGHSGAITPSAAPYIVPVLTPAVTVNGQPVQVLFYAEAPQMVAGVLQINIQIPRDAPSGDLPVIVSFGNAASQLKADGGGAVTVAVQ